MTEQHEWDDMSLSEKMRVEIAMASCYADDVEKLEQQIERLREAIIAEIHIYRMPQGDWAFAYRGVVMDGFGTAEEAISFALLAKDGDDDLATSSS